MDLEEFDMPKLILQNQDTKPVRIEARLSNGGEPFNDLPLVCGFPRVQQPEEVAEIDMGDFCELLYRRDLNPDRPEWMSDLYRIPMSSTDSVCKGYIWPFP